MLPSEEYNLCQETGNLSNFAANFAIFKPNLNLKAHSYLVAAITIQWWTNEKQYDFDEMYNLMN